MSIFTFIAFLAAARGLSHYSLDPRSVAVFPHYQSPFTQGLFVLSSESPAGGKASVGRCLTGCLESLSGESLSRGKPRTSVCYVECLRSHSLCLYESVGGYGTSEFRVIRDFEEGVPESRLSFPSTVFGEGSDLVHSNETHHHFLMGTWRSKVIYLLSQSREGGPVSLERTIKMRQHRELWGVAADSLSQRVWITTGESEVYTYRAGDFLKDENPIPINVVTLRCDGQPIKRVNELDYDKSTGTLWANVWFSSLLYQFDPDSGKCLAKLDVEDSDPRIKKIAKANQSNINSVWNGIATLGDRWLIFTGKLFPYIFIARYTL
ncbi:glutamine cyclotransferase [Gregarina niphandrodes]|uniref:Glutamine cyclotransferase n=1 Tax=Gregarina niphandrodes TaxID=110365 RepID=A0A023BAI1_GRENI|nr:glutamine cyclotransferase [Gregarina niphandrodes]EZG78223.1 glutamine cyclotransferase [Gregarina niphandrodes]|eukprot:XP_011129391.1 glutamine cyclotransferase [Gregarina niphandrodes]